MHASPHSQHLWIGRLPWLFVATAAIYMALLPLAPFPGSFLPKTLPIWLLMAYAWATVPGIRGRLLGLGLLLSSVGDVALTVNRPVGFMVGLGFFLLAHLVYLACFLRHGCLLPSRIPYFAVILAVGVGMSCWLEPHLGEMALPVFCYIGVITCMALAAGISAGTRPRLMLGAAIFMLSDSLIAIHKFVAPVWGAKYWIMLTYYVAQGFIVWAFVPCEAGDGPTAVGCGRR